MLIQTIHTAEFDMDYFKFGNGKRVLIIIPGVSLQSVMLSADLVAEAYALLTDEFTIYVFDRRREMPDDYDIPGMAKDTEKAIRALGLEKISIFGASQGGMIAMNIALDAPELVDKLIIGSSAALVDDRAKKVFRRWIALAETQDPVALSLDFGETLYPKSVFEQSRQLLIDAASTVTSKDLSRFIIMTRCLLNYDIRNVVNKIACPLLVIGDEDDQVLGSDEIHNFDIYLKDKQNYRLHMYSGYGHAAYDIAPDYRALMLEFLKS